MSNERPELELARLREQQSKTRHDEVFGGLSPAERSAYDGRQIRINELELNLPERHDEHQRRPLISRNNGQH
jgi:hypothetical protein